jgi:molybdopterin-containing oxidoreductase family membrane subunit
MPGWARRLRSVHHIAPVLALAGLCLSMLHQSSLGATYGVLKARAFWYQPGLAVMFMVSALAAGPALTVLLSTLAGHLSPRAIVDKALLAKLTTFIGWVLAAYLYMRLWDVLSASYTYEAGRTEAWQMLLRGPMAVNFWVGELALGIVVPMILLLVAPFKRHEGYRTLALMLVVGGLVAYRWDINLAGQLIVAGQLPHVMVPQFTQYVPSLIEIMTGAGVVAYGLLAFSLGVNYLRVVEHVEELADSAESPVRHPAPAVALTSS